MNETFWHLAAYFASLTNGTTNSAVAAVQDQILTRTTSNNFILPRPGRLRMMYSAGASILRARVNTPSLRYVGLPFVGPVNTALVVPSPSNLTDWGELGPPIPTADEVSVEHSLGGAAPENEFSLVWFSFGPPKIVGGPVYRIRFTASITCSAGTWVNGSMTPDQTLPAGTYSVVGMTANGTNLAAARLVFANGGFRPGCLTMNAVNSIPQKVFTDGSLGQYGVFDSVNIPTLDAFSVAACTSQEVYLDIVRLGDRRGM